MRKTLSILMIIGSIQAFAQHLNFKNITVADGLPQSQVYDMEQASDGTLWMATQGGGVCIYNGKSFKVIDSKSGLKSNYVQCIELYKNRMYIGTDRGLMYAENDSIYEVNFPGIRKINCLVNHHDTLLIGTQNGLFYTLGKSIRRHPQLPEKGKVVAKITVLNKGIILSGVNKTETFVDENQGLVNYSKELPLINDAIQLGEQTYFATYGGGLVIYSEYDIPKTLLDNHKVMDLFLDNDSIMWIGTQTQGIYRLQLKTGALENFTSKDGLANDHVRCIKQDIWGNIWIGTSGGGVSRYSGSQFLHYTKSSGLNGNYIYSVLNDSKGNLWVGTSGLGVFRRNDSSQILYNSNNQFVNDKVKGIVEDSKGNIWIASENRGIGVYTQSLGLDSLIYFGVRKGGFNGNIKTITEGKSGTIWIGTAGTGLFKARFYFKDSVPKLIINKVNFDIEDFPNRINHLSYLDGQLAIATQGKGILLISKEKQASYDMRAGLNSNDIRSVKFDKDGKLWYISNRGLGYIENDKIRNFSLNDGLKSLNCYQLLHDASGHIWVGSERGLDRIYVMENDSVSVKHFGFNEGFRGVETTTNGCHIDSKGQLWFGSVNGLSVYSPRKILTNDKPPILKLKKYNLFYRSIFDTEFGKNQNQFDTIELPHKENSLSFEFEGIFLNNPELVSYQYKLFKDGMELPALTNLSSVQYSNLDPAFYKLEVRAVRNGILSKPIVLHFNIKPPYWKTKWFIFFASVGVLLLLGLILWLNSKRLKRKLKTQREKLEIQRNLAELEQKALRLQMNPHFLFNILNSVQYLINDNNPQKAKHALGKFAKLMRQILENSREKLISIDDELSTIQNYIALEKLTTSTNFEFEVHIDDETDTVDEILPPLMIQPFVENAIIHAFKGLDRTARIDIYFEEKPNFLEIEVRDNGIGRKQAKLNRAQVETYHKSQALQVTQERLSNLNSDADFKSFEIIDHYEKEVPAGTSVILRVSL